MEKANELLEWLHQQLDAKNEFPTYGRVSFHVYSRKLIGGGVECNLWFGSVFSEADMKLQEEKPGALTVAVVPVEKLSIDYSGKKRLPRTAKLEELRQMFPNGRNIDLIVDELLTSDGD